MVRDGYFYGFGFIAAAVLVFLVTGSWVWAVAPFCWHAFFSGSSAIPSGRCRSRQAWWFRPADGKITEVARIQTPEGERIRLSIFLSVFDVHVNRSPIAGTVREVRYQKGKHLNALNPDSAKNEQNVVTVHGDEFDVIFSQIAGILARRIVFRFRAGRFCGARPTRRSDQIRLPGQRCVACLMRTSGWPWGNGSREALPCWPISIQPRTRDRSTCWRRVSLEPRRLQAAGSQPAPDRKRRGRLRRGMYILPSLFTAGNIAAGYFAIMQSLQGSVQEPRHFDYAALAIGFAIPFDAIDGRIARMTKTTSEFGKELDSLADVITFGVAPSILAFTWGFQMLPTGDGSRAAAEHRAVGGIRLLSFPALRRGPPGALQYQHQSVAQQSRPARTKILRWHAHSRCRRRDCRRSPFLSGTPVPNWRVAIMWMLLVFLVGFLMVSTWRFWSGKEINLSDRHPFQQHRLPRTGGLRDRCFLPDRSRPVGFLLYVFRHLRPSGVLLAADKLSTAQSPTGRRSTPPEVILGRSTFTENPGRQGNR